MEKGVAIFYLAIPYSLICQQGQCPLRREGKIGNSKTGKYDISYAYHLALVVKDWSTATPYGGLSIKDQLVFRDPGYVSLSSQGSYESSVGEFQGQLNKT